MGGQRTDLHYLANVQLPHRRGFHRRSGFTTKSGRECRGYYPSCTIWSFFSVLWAMSSNNVRTSPLGVVRYGRDAMHRVSSGRASVTCGPCLKSRSLRNNVKKRTNKSRHAFSGQPSETYGPCLPSSFGRQYLKR